MVRKAELPQSRHHVMVFDEDWEFLSQAFGPGSSKPIGPGNAIKTLVHGYVSKIRAQAQEREDSGQKMGMKELGL